jgi:ribose transport system ATP-binding protein
MSEDRKGDGLILIRLVLENAGVTLWQRLANRARFLTLGRIQQTVMPAITKLEVKTPSLDQTLGNLSGGNQ